MRSPFILVGALVGGLTTSQFPEYAQQYHQRLGGAVEELHAIVLQFDQDAANQGLKRDEALLTYQRSTEEFLNERGKSMQAILDRFANLTAHQEALQSAGPVEELMAFSQHLDPNLLNDTLEIYKPAVPITAKGFAYAGVGLLAGLLVFRFIWGILTFPFRKRVRLTK